MARLEAAAFIRTSCAVMPRWASGLATVNVTSVMRSSAAPTREHNPDHPLADANGDIWTSPVDENAEMVEMLDASRQYQNLVEALTTAKQLMLETMRMK